VIKNPNEGVLERAAHLLDVFREPPFRFSYSDICNRVEMPRATVHRMLNQLTQIGYLTRSNEGKDYKLGPRLRQIIHFNLGCGDLGRIFHPILSELANASGKSTFAARLQGSAISVFLVEQPETSNETQVVPGFGVRPMNACSSTKAILAYQDKSMLNKILSRPMEAFTPRTITDIGGLQKELVQVRKLGFAVCDEEIDEAVVSVAVPVKVDKLGVLYSIGVIGLKSNFPSEKFSRLREQLMQAAKSIETGLSRGSSGGGS
jgi:DNA-binding IclR family transcriptional regulator